MQHLNLANQKDQRRLAQHYRNNPSYVITTNRNNSFNYGHRHNQVSMHLADT